MTYSPAPYILGQGTTVSYCATLGGTYTALADIVDAETAPYERDDSDATNLASVEETTLPGWIKKTTAKMTFYFVVAQLSTLLGIWSGGTVYFLKITLPLASGQSTTGTIYSGPAYLTKLTPSKSEKLNNDHLMYDVEMTRTQTWIVTAGS